jgi:hypothetical protein
VFLLTKSNLILRDIELLKEINQLAHVNINFSIAFSDEEMKQRFEPNSPSIRNRLDALKTLRQAGIHGGVMGLPVVPHVADSIDMLRELVSSVKAAKSEFLLLGGMTLKPGRQKQHFFSVVQRYYPENVKKIHEMYSNNNRYGQPKNPGTVNPFLLGPILCEEQGLRWLSIRHPYTSDYVDISRLLIGLLETVFIRNTLLREPKSKWGPYHSVAVKIEKGLPPIKEVLNTPEMAQKHQIPFNMIPELHDMAFKGTSPELLELKTRILSNAKKILETLS